MSTVNVLRYSALALGAIIGLKTDLSLKSEAAKSSQQKEYAEKLKLIEQAKAEYARLHAPKQVEKQADTKLDLEDPNLDYGKVILSAVESLKQ